MSALGEGHVVAITGGDVCMGAALVLEIEGGVVRLDGHRISSFSVVERRAYTSEPGPAAKSPASIGYWELTGEQAAELLEKAPRLRISTEVGPMNAIHLGRPMGGTACCRRGVPAFQRTADPRLVTCEACAESEASS